MFLLIPLRVITVMAGNQHKTSKLLMHKLSMTAFTAMYPHKSGCFEVRHQLADFARHMSYNKSAEPLWQAQPK